MKPLAPFRPNRLKAWDPSMKNGRFSSKYVSKTDRLTTAGSTSTWPKSGLTVASMVMLLLRPHFRSRPPAADWVRPSSKGLPAAAVPLNSPRAVMYGSSSRCLRLPMPSNPPSSPASDTTALSFFGMNAHHVSSFFRWTTRTAWKPHTWRSAAAKRNCENGIRISAIQPWPSIVTAASQTPFHVSSSLESL